MSRRRRKKTNWKCTVAWPVMEKIAALLIAEHEYLTAGLALQQSSGVWAKANGLYTDRLVYRAEGRASLVFSFTNIPLRCDQVEA